MTWSGYHLSMYRYCSGQEPPKVGKVMRLLAWGHATPGPACAPTTLPSQQRDIVMGTGGTGTASLVRV